MKKIILYFLLILFFSPNYAQNPNEVKLNFKLTDKKNKAVPYSKVYLVEKETGDTIRKRLNAEGYAFFYLLKTNSYTAYVQNKATVLDLHAENGADANAKIVLESASQMPSSREDTIFQFIPLKQRSTRNEQLLRFQVIDRDSRTLANITIQLVDEQTKQRFISISDELGQVRFLLPEGSYKMIAEDNIDYPVVNVKRKTGMLVTEFITLRTTPVIEKTEQDTITQSFPQRIVPTYGRTMLTVRISDRRDRYMVGESVYINVDSTALVYKGVTDMTGVVHFLLPKGHVYYVHTASERNIEAIEMPKVAEKLWIELAYSYYDAEMLRRQAEAKKTSGSSSVMFDDTKPTMEDSVVYTVLNRMKNVQKKLIVTDITGSMYPYINQLLAWYKLNYTKESKADLVFFNDGDSKSDDKKRIGTTGGIYNCYQCLYDSCLKTMIRAASAGGGGDTPENNIEALLYAIKNVKSYDALIMIADNYATPRDMELLRKVKIPVRVIVCGAFHGAINSAYLKVARDTKGAVYTMEEELLGLAQLHEGEYFELGDKVYKIRNGEFVYVKNKKPKYKTK